ncbi:MAG: ABC transporter substrate-binding protein [Pirellula sp.]
MKALRIVAILAVVVLTTILIFRRQHQSGNGNIAIIGAVLPLTGEVAAYGTDTRDGIDLAVEQANRSQNRLKFEVTYEDSKGDAKTAVTALQSLLSLKRPIAVIGENTSSATLAMVPIATAAKVPLISPSASAPNLSGISPYFFRVFPSDTEEGTFISKAVAKHTPGASVVVIYVNNDYGFGLKNVFSQTAPANGLRVIGDFGYEKATSDFKPILTKIKDLKPNAIYLPSYYQDGSMIVKQARELGIEASLWGCTTHEDPKFLEVAGAAAEGFFYPISTGYDAKSTSNEVLEFMTGFKAQFNKEPGLLAALGYDCARLIISPSLKGEASSSNVKTFIESQKAYPGVSGLMSFDEKGDVHKPISLKTVKSGQFTDAKQ